MNRGGVLVEVDMGSLPNLGRHDALASSREKRAMIVRSQLYVRSLRGVFFAIASTSTTTSFSGRLIAPASGVPRRKTVGSFLSVWA